MGRYCFTERHFATRPLVYKVVFSGTLAFVQSVGWLIVILELYKAAWLCLYRREDVEIKQKQPMAFSDCSCGRSVNVYGGHAEARTDSRMGWIAEKEMITAKSALFVRDCVCTEKYYFSFCKPINVMTHHQFSKTDLHIPWWEWEWWFRKTLSNCLKFSQIVLSHCQWYAALTVKALYLFFSENDI